MLEQKIIEELNKRKWKICTAESCTGGLIAAALVDVPGASAVFEEGYITYSNAAKQRLLGVEQDKLQRFGAVSREVAGQMARGAAKASHADAAVAVTGIAGPGGGTPQKPVGLVYIGCFVDGRVFVTENHFTGERRRIREQTVESAFTLLWKCLTDEKSMMEMEGVAE